MEEALHWKTTMVHMDLQPWDGSEIMFIIVRTFKEFVTIDDKVY